MPRKPASNLFKKLSNNRLFRAYLLWRLPLAYIAGVKVVAFRRDSATMSIRYRWINTNPFKSMYFAAMNMGAELACGLLVFAHINEVNPKISMLLEDFNSHYVRKGLGKVLFICQQGDEIKNAVEIASETTETQKLNVKVHATDVVGTILATFEMQWSLKNLAD
jgi:hypothetical protein